MRRKVERTYTETDITCDLCGETPKLFIAVPVPCVMCRRDVCNSKDCGHTEVKHVYGGTEPIRYCYMCWKSGRVWRGVMAEAKAVYEAAVKDAESKWTKACESEKQEMQEVRDEV